MLSHIATLAALAATALADGASIVASIQAITNDTLALHDAVTSWGGDLLGTLPIVTQSATLLSDIKAGTADAEASDPITDLDALNVAVATQTLAGDVNTTLKALIAAKPDFDHLLLSPVILLNLKLEQAATNDFSDAVIEKVPEDLQETAETLVAGIAQSFDIAIEEYDLF